MALIRPIVPTKYLYDNKVTICHYHNHYILYIVESGD